jgi:PKD repeat protein
LRVPVGEDRRQECGRDDEGQQDAAEVPGNRFILPGLVEFFLGLPPRRLVLRVEEPVRRLEKPLAHGELHTAAGTLRQAEEAEGLIGEDGEEESEEEIKASYNSGKYRLYHNFTLKDGTYSYKAYAQDLVGNLNETEVRTLTIDTTPPDVMIISPENKTYTTSRIEINVSASDPSGIEEVTAQIDGETNLTLQYEDGYYVGSVDLSNGDHHLDVIAKDKAENVGKSGVNFTVRSNNVPPVANFHVNGDRVYTNKTVVFNATPSYDPDGYIVSYRWDFDDGNVTSVNTPTIAHVYLMRGTYNVTLTVIDNMGLSNSSTKSITVFLKGDFNGNGFVDISDVCYVACMVVGLTNQNLDADFNSNNRIDIGDLHKVIDVITKL